MAGDVKTRLSASVSVPVKVSELDNMTCCWASHTSFMPSALAQRSKVVASLPSVGKICQVRLMAPGTGGAGIDAAGKPVL
jgi:hypothetical protein